MLRPLTVLCFVLAMPACAFAQAQPPSSIQIPIRQMPNSSGIRSDQRGSGITVSGFGQAEAPADAARVMLNLSSRNNTLSLNKTSLQPVVDALVAAHVEPASIIEPIYLQGAASTNYATVSGTVNHPTVAMLQDGLQSLTSAFAAMPAILVNQASVNISVMDCTLLRTAARRAALAQAHEQAQEIATASNVRLGKILSVQAYGDSGGSSSDPLAPKACSSYYQIGPGSMPPFMTLADYLKVRIMSNVNVTYAIR